MRHGLQLVLIVLALAASTSAQAQAPAAGPSANTSRPQPASPGPSGFLDAAQNVVNAIDRYEMGTVWDVASPIMKASITKDRFVSSIAQSRALLGSIRTRDWTSIMRVPITQAGGPLPVGQYISVRFATSGQNGRVAEEIISFNLDRDGQWRLAGYTIQ